MKILSKPRGNAEEYGRWSVNPYKGCPHGCLYCYLKDGVWAKGLGGSVPTLKEHIVNKEHAYHVAMAEILENRDQIIRDGGLFMTFTSDPCIKETCSLFFRIAADAIGLDKPHIPVTMLTKDANFCFPKNDRATLEEHIQACAWRGNIDVYTTSQKYLAVGWTLTGHDELEPNASPNDERIRAMAYLSGRGYHTWASIEPVIDFNSSLNMIQKAVEAGCEHFKIGLMTKNTRVCRNRYDVIECMKFITDVLTTTNGKATVYWKQSVHDLLGTVYTTAAVDEILDQPNAVSKDWSMFGNGQNNEQKSS